MSVAKEDDGVLINRLLVVSLLLCSIGIAYFSVAFYGERSSNSNAIRVVYMKWAQGDTREERDVAEVFMRCLSRSASFGGGVSAMPKLDDCLKLAGSNEFAKEVMSGVER